MLSLEIKHVAFSDLNGDCCETAMFGLTGRGAGVGCVSLARDSQFVNQWPYLLICTGYTCICIKGIQLRNTTQATRRKNMSHFFIVSLFVP